MDGKPVDDIKPASPQGPADDGGQAPQGTGSQPAPGAGQAVPLPGEDTGAEPIRMPQFYGKDAEKQRRVLKKWLKLKRREARRKALREKLLRIWSRVRPFVLGPMSGLRRLWALVKALLKAPFDSLSARLEASREAKEAARREAMKRNMPAREAAARKRWEARLARGAVWEKRLQGLRKAGSRLRFLVPHPRRWYRKLKKVFWGFVLTPFQAIARARDEARERRDAKLREEFARTAKSRETIIQKKHAKLMMREMRRRERAEKRRRRWAGVRRFLSRLRQIWSNLEGLRKLIYLIVLIILAWIYRVPILEKISKIIDFDLQSLMR